MTETAAAIPGGERIGDFQILEKLGAGGMGVVYKATDLRLERTVALKFLPAELSVEPNEKELLAREAKAASALDHTNIGVIHGLEETPDGKLFIVMGFYDGETLAAKIRRGPLPLGATLDIACQVARGLSEAHTRHIVHRDIKPSNIIITGRGVAKIVDFGLARVINSASSQQSIRTSGTAAYMSPEQAMGKSLDHRTDVWSLGVVMVEMATGARPFGGENITGLMWEILNHPPALMDNLPPELKPIIYRALAKDPGQRYPNCEAMLVDLEQLRAELSRGSGRLSDVEVTKSAHSQDFADAVKHASQPTWSQSGSAAAVAPGSKFRWWYLAAAAGLLLLVAAASLLIPAVRERAAEISGVEEKHIAVLPFDNIGNDPANAALAEGLMDSLTAELSNLGAGKSSLWVVPSSVVRRRNVDDPSTALRDLGATLVVKGSIARQGQNIQLTVSLIDTRNLRQIGSLMREDPAGDLATLQNEAVAGIARLMKLQVSPEMVGAGGGGVAPAAYESYLTALGYVQRYDKPGNLDLAIASLQQAVKTDPRFALGYAELGEAYRLKYQLDQNPKWIDEAIANCNRATQLDDRLPAIYVTLGKLHSQSGKNDLALQEFQHALQLDPHSAEALTGVASAYEQMGRIQDAEDGFKRAAALRPDYWEGYNVLGIFYDRQQRYPEAIAQLKKVVQLTPDNAQAYSNLAAVYLDTSDPKWIPDAQAALTKSVAITPSYPAYANLGSLYFNQGRYAESAAMTEQALQINDKDYQVWYNLLLSYQWLGQKDKAANAAERTMSLLEALVQTKPQDPEIQSALGMLYAEQKNPDKAVPHIEAALALGAKDNRVLGDAGEAYESMGNRTLALRYLHESLKAGETLDGLRTRPGLQTVLNDPSFRANGK
jgi:serine/threonine protein kinase/tetratricopeptide (TPR) repeat protein